MKIWLKVHTRQLPVAMDELHQQSQSLVRQWMFRHQWQESRS